ncbi:MAG TPA: tRNA uridine-5-carboxymethylaminomethyl(34) synthesis GTPase MnmE [Thermoanaerobacterales bacterium]|nr:tRNA uridine-5-carboxymethylaminomethyl(34) synthesis GTPase MnmE [Thermoanaerobacterales bacterium]
MKIVESSDTIAAISTAIGEGGIGIVRISGPKSFEIAKEIFKPRQKNIKEFESRKLYLGNIVDFNDEIVDEVLIAFFKSPHTYTREDMVEINCHGGLAAQKRILRLVLDSGARLAEPGEFTKRAFLNGRIDLSQAEAVIDIIRAKTDKALSLANRQLSGGLSNKINAIRHRLLDVLAHIAANIDFPEDDIPEASTDYIAKEVGDVKEAVGDLLKRISAGRVIREGLATLILGNTNVGKSSLLNALLDEERAIVTDIPGTTRDIIEEYIDINGIPIKIIDTAGIRETADEVERIGIQRAIKYLEEAELVLLLIDISRELTQDDINLIKLIKDKTTIVVINKVDLPAKIDEEDVKRMIPAERIVKISALKQEGIQDLKNAIYEVITAKIGGIGNEGLIGAGERQRQAIEAAYNFLDRALLAIKSFVPIEMVELDIRDAWQKLGEITGDTVTEDIISTIFEKFCIGK